MKTLKINNAVLLASLFIFFFSSHIGAQTANNCYALLINGGAKKESNFEGYYNSMAFVYKTLVNEYNYDEDNIFVLNSDGWDTGDDMYKDKPFESPPYEYVSSPQSLDGNTSEDIDYSATADNIIEVFEDLESDLTSSDFLFIYLTGAGLTSTNSRYYTWDENPPVEIDYLTDANIENFIDQIDAGKIVVLAAYPYCGTLSDNLESTNRVILSSNDYDEDDVMGTLSGKPYEEFTYYWTSALAGETPGQTTVDADDNEDGEISIYEAFIYADCANSNNSTPLYYSNIGTLGENLTMTGEELCVTIENFHDESVFYDEIVTLNDCYIDIEDVIIEDGGSLSATAEVDIYVNGVDVEGGSTLILTAENDVIIDSNFEVTSGSVLTIN